MKYLIVVPDGAGDEVIEALGNRTPLEAADLKYINELASKGQVGMVKTVPDGIPPGSDAANLSVMGYDPTVYLTGRSPLEAASIGIPMNDTDVSYRANIVTLEGDGAYEDLTIVDHSGGDISTEEADQLIQAVNGAFADNTYKFYTGTGYRHCLIVHDGERTAFDLTPPHDVLGQKTGSYLPKGEGSEFLTDFMKRSYEILNNHPVNMKRREAGLKPANSLWIWGQGTRPELTSFSDKYGITGTAISAVDLIKGIAVLAGLDAAEVEGATGTLNTNFKGKADAAIEAFDSGKDFVYIHLEGPDECSHQGDMEGKIKCLEDIDKKVVMPVVEALKEKGEDFRVLVVPDHRTPLAIRTHSDPPVPFVLYDSRAEEIPDSSRQFCEKSGEKGRYFSSGYQLADYFFEK